MGVAGPIDGWKLLDAMGVDPSRKIRKATITIAVDCPVVLTVEEYVQPFEVVGDEVRMVVTGYEWVEKKEPPQAPDAGGINGSGMYEWHEHEVQ